MKSLKYISLQKKKFEKEIYFKNLSPDFGKPQKFHDFVFVSTGFWRKSFPPEKESSKM